MKYWLRKLCQLVILIIVVTVLRILFQTVYNNDVIIIIGGTMYNSPKKVKVAFVDLLNRNVIEDEIKLPVHEFKTREKAYRWVSDQIVQWVYDEGNLKHCSFLEPLLWDVV